MVSGGIDIQNVVCISKVSRSVYLVVLHHATLHVYYIFIKDADIIYLNVLRLNVTKLLIINFTLYIGN